MSYTTLTSTRPTHTAASDPHHLAPLESPFGPAWLCSCGDRFTDPADAGQHTTVALRQQPR